MTREQFLKMEMKVNKNVESHYEFGIFTAGAASKAPSAVEKVTCLIPFSLKNFGPSYTKKADTESSAKLHVTL